MRTRGPVVAVMSRAPVPGRTKSRLAAAIGDEPAARLARAFLLDAASAVRTAEAWTAALLVEPAEAVAELRKATGIDNSRAQGSGDIGMRMLHGARTLEAGAFSPIVLVGSDIPMLSASRLHQALRALRRADVVFGPAEDGGYYLIGMWRLHPALFEATSLFGENGDESDGGWSGSDVLDASERLAHSLGLSTARLAPERDIDTAEDLSWLLDRCAELELRGGTPPAHTAAALGELREAGELDGLERRGGATA